MKLSFSEFFFFVFFLSIGVVIFLSIIYYVERDLFGIKFVIILELFWWVVVIMIILGYGDMILKFWEGRIVGLFCVISGVFMIVFLVLVIVSNFLFYYFYVKVRLKLFKRKRFLIIGVVNVFKVV